MINLVKIKSNNNINFDNKIYDFKSPKRVLIPISECDYRKGDYIYKNTYFDKYISSISGYIEDVKKIKINNKMNSFLVIKNDYEENVKEKIRKKKINNKEELISVLNIFKFENLIKKMNKDFSNIIITSIDEEEYSLKEYYYLKYYYQDILNTINDLMKLFNIKECILATKDTNLESIQNVKSIIGTYPNILVNLVPNRYLISYPSFICEYFNYDYNNTLVLTTSDIINIYNSINYKIINETLITIGGTALEKNIVINVKLYTPLSEVLEEYFDIVDNKYEVYVNGTLSGYKVNNIDDVIINLDTSCIIINKSEYLEETECINCGACQRICPFKINVKKCYQEKLNHKKCISCGLCDYICPANLKLKKILGGNNANI